MLQSFGRGYRAAYLSLTRGDGGQNELGKDFDEKLGVLRTQDFATWEDVSAELVMPAGIRHGTVLRVPRAVVSLLISPNPVKP